MWRPRANLLVTATWTTAACRPPQAADEPVDRCSPVLCWANSCTRACARSCSRPARARRRWRSRRSDWSALGRVRLHVRVDERSAGFLALGLAKVSGDPVAVICTSGTAVANLTPSVVEASYAAVPLVVVTADRPPEARGVGAPQTIDQHEFFGQNVRSFAEVERAPAPGPGRPGRSGAGRAGVGRRRCDGGPRH